MDEGTAEERREPSDGTRRFGAAPQGQPFLHKPVALVTLVGGVIGIIAAIVGIVVAFTGPLKPAEGEERKAAVEACMVRHGLDDPHEKNEGGTAGTVLFRECTWPAPAGAEADGYTEIAVTSYDGPGESEAEGMTVANRVRSACRDVELVYLFNNQGTFVQADPTILSKGEIRRVEGGSVWIPENETEAKAFTPRRDESIVMSNARYKLDSARCL
ncbi:hypothetical protein [Rhodococcus maanshanensis]|uniref:Uncharacterized protein n=1 Tax=Rhodococcus maanshanensis TaxID=183556 RepID=A0A1H7HFW8_9NOCA|nr:hypothetical protein [Rhodococcus maanshanensis]SEK49199.1 hypothetical protein SAMN05444583_102110 [Rhodococcus maanshanensis]